MESTGPLWPMNWCRRLSLARPSQTAISALADPETISSPPRAYATSLTAPVCPRYVESGLFSLMNVG